MIDALLAEQPAPAQEPVGFDEWWNNEGSQAPKPTDDMYEHCKRMCEIAWSNGVYKALEKAPPAPAKQWVGLTNDERKKLADVIRFNNIWYLEDMLRAAEEMLERKNT